MKLEWYEYVSWLEAVEGLDLWSALDRVKAAYKKQKGRELPEKRVQEYLALKEKYPRLFRCF